MAKKRARTAHAAERDHRRCTFAEAESLKSNDVLQQHGFARLAINDKVKYECPRCRIRLCRSSAFNHVDKYYLSKRCKRVKRLEQRVDHGIASTAMGADETPNTADDGQGWNTPDHDQHAPTTVCPNSLCC